MKYTNVYLGLGSNLGNRSNYLHTAIEILQKDDMVNVVKLSEVIETEPIGEIAQGLFLNQVIEIETEYGPNELLQRCLEIEQSQGRVREKKWDSRTLDIDILFYGELLFESNNLKIPHPEVHNRGFMLIPLLEIAPSMEHPSLHLSIQEMLNAL